MPVVETDLVLVFGRKIAWFQCGHRTTVVFVYVVENNLLTMWGIKLDVISGIGNDFDFVWVVEIDLVLE